MKYELNWDEISKNPLLTKFLKYPQDITKNELMGLLLQTCDQYVLPMIKKYQADFIALIHFCCLMGLLEQLKILEIKFPIYWKNMIQTHHQVTFEGAVLNNQVEILKYLEEKVPNTFHEMIHSYTIWEVAVKEENIEVLRYFVEKIDLRAISCFQPARSYFELFGVRYAFQIDHLMGICLKAKNVRLISELLKKFPTHYILSLSNTNDLIYLQRALIEYGVPKGLKIKDNDALNQQIRLINKIHPFIHKMHLLSLLMLNFDSQFDLDWFASDYLKDMLKVWGKLHEIPITQQTINNNLFAVKNNSLLIKNADINVDELKSESCANIELSK